MLGEPLSSKNNWQARRAIIDSMPHHTVKQLETLFDAKRISLGIVRPRRVLDLRATKVECEWPAKYQALWSQMRLFGKQKLLHKLPYKFQYVFECEDNPKPHCVMNEDWELGVLFWKERERKGSEAAAIQGVKQKFFNEMCRADKDTRFFMGTRNPYNEWIVIGTFWPPKVQEEMLFPL
jgi:hypothetical protein